MSALTHRRLWKVAGFLVLAHVILVFAGAAFSHSLQLGDRPNAATAALVASSMTRNYFGGYVSYLGVLVFLVVAMLLARLLHRESETSGWLSSCIAASAITYVAVTVATGFAAGAAALYGGHHGTTLATATTVNDIRNFGFVLSAGLVGLFALSVAAAGRVSRALPRWLSYTGAVVGAGSILSVPGARLGLTDVSTMLWFVWFAALGVAAVGVGRRTTDVLVGAASVPG